MIWRDGRFDLVGSPRTWRSDAAKDYQTGSCQNLEIGAEGGYQDRVENIAVRLYDEVAKNYINVASVH